MDKYNVTVDGHSATITLIDDPSDVNAFTGTIDAGTFGQGTISNGTKTPAPGGFAMSGRAELDGHSLSFKAATAGSSIVGQLRQSIFFAVSFTGSKIQEASV